MAAPLSLSSIKLSQFKTNPLLLRVSAGRHELTGGSFLATTFCVFEVRTNRVTSAALAFEGSNVRCQCTTLSSASTLQKPVCI
jgi:hypothetical protein